MSAYQLLVDYNNVLHHSRPTPRVRPQPVTIWKYYWDLILPTLWRHLGRIGHRRYNILVHCSENNQIDCNYILQIDRLVANDKNTFCNIVDKLALVTVEADMPICVEKNLIDWNNLVPNHIIIRNDDKDICYSHMGLRPFKGLQIISLYEWLKNPPHKYVFFLSLIQEMVDCQSGYK